MPGHPTNLDNNRAKAHCLCSRCGCGLFRHLFSLLSFFFSFSRYLKDDLVQTEILSQRAIKPKTTTTQPKSEALQSGHAQYQI